MKTSRRKFLGFIGLSPIAAKAAADELAIKEMLGTGVSNFGSLSPGPILNSAGGSSSEPNWMKPLKWLKQNKLPDWTLDQIRNDCRQVSALDPDIAAKRSWSPAVKIAEQRERNYQREVARVIRGPEMHSIRESFHQKTGIWI